MTPRVKPQHYPELFQRHEQNPILTANDWPYPVHTVFNAGACQIDDTTLEITELPVRKWTQDYKEFLEELAKPEDKAAQPFITDYREHHTDASVRFVVTLPEGKMREALEERVKLLEQR